MQHTILHSVGRALRVVGVAALLALSPYASAKQICERATETCLDNAPRLVPLSDGGTGSVSVPPPIIDGTSSACWTWQRTYTCIESNPEYRCESGADYAQVKDDCGLTAGKINSITQVRGVNFITSATYTYRCEFSKDTCSTTLPGDKECVALTTEVTPATTEGADTSGTTPALDPNNPASTPGGLSEQLVTEEDRTTRYSCYGAEVTTCSTMCQETVVDPVTGTMEAREVVCNAPITNCVPATSQCASALVGGVTTVEVGGDGRCIRKLESSVCQVGEVPRCLTDTSCTLTNTTPADIQANGIAYTQEQSYVCSNTSETCTELVEVPNCLSTNAWGWDRNGIPSQLGEGLGEVNAALAKVEGIQRGISDKDLFIFSGDSRKCRYPVGNFLNTLIMTAFSLAMTFLIPGGGLVANGLQMLGMSATNAAIASVALSATTSFLQDAPTSKAFGKDCCKDFVIEGSDKWYKMGSCKPEEVKLAVARRKGLYHYLGTYCSKKSGFPKKQCVEKTKSYCTFDDMLALTVNEEGRAQLDQIAAADAATSSASSTLSFDAYATLVDSGPYADRANGQWKHLVTHNNSQIWYWQWPGYCRTPDTQKAAYDVYMAEVSEATSIKGATVSGQNLTQQAAIDLGKRILNLPDWQDCASTPGDLPFLTCNKDDDSCNVAALPEGPENAELDLSGNDVSAADIFWEVQQVNSIAMPGDYGVTATMPSNSGFAAQQESVNRAITSVGSCHATGACLYYFTVTNKQAANGFGARKQITESISFPLYAFQSVSQPAIDYLSPQGALDTAAWGADPNVGLGQPYALSMQQFIFRPHTVEQSPKLGDQIHSHVLLEWVGGAPDVVTPRNGVEAIVVPTNLPPGTPGFWPTSQGFYLSGACDPMSRWCSYDVTVELKVERHPWGSAKVPRCWGFTLDQMAALDFNKMDLSKWIDSLNLDGMSQGMDTQAATAMSNQAMKTADVFYQSMSTGAPTAKPTSGTLALVVNTNTLPLLASTEESSYTVVAAVPANWPMWYDYGVNANPTSNVVVDWGDGSPTETMVRAGDNNRGWTASHDYGDRPVGTYTLRVTMNTKDNGVQKLSTDIRITPNSGKTPENTNKLIFDRDGQSGSESLYDPSQVTGFNQDAGTLEGSMVSPGMSQSFKDQGSSVKTP